MKWRLRLAAMVGLLAAFPALASAQNLLTNGGLELVPPDGGGFYSSPPGWTAVEGPSVPYLQAPYVGDYNNGGVTTLPCPGPPGATCGALDAADYVMWRKHNNTNFALPNDPTPGAVNDQDYAYWRRHFGEPFVLSMAEPSNFGHLLFEGDWQYWFQPYQGTQAGYTDNFAHLTQSVPGTPGQQYTMKGWALFENYFPGGVTNLNAETSPGVPSGAPFDDGPLSPTDTFFALEFLNSSGTVLAGSVEIELKAAGQPSNTVWTQHSLTGVAPAGTTQVRVRATMTDGVYNPLPSPQVFQMSFLIDDFSLVADPGGSGSGGAVPEPATWLMLSMALAAATACRRSPRVPFGGN